MDRLLDELARGMTGTLTRRHQAAGPDVPDSVSASDRERSFLPVLPYSTRLAAPAAGFGSGSGSSGSRLSIALIRPPRLLRWLGLAIIGILAICCLGVAVVAHGMAGLLEELRTGHPDLAPLPDGPPMPANELLIDDAAFAAHSAAHPEAEFDWLRARAIALVAAGRWRDGLELCDRLQPLGPGVYHADLRLAHVECLLVLGHTARAVRLLDGFTDVEELAPADQPRLRALAARAQAALP